MTSTSSAAPTSHTAPITSADFEVPAALQDIPGSNVPKNKKYDQMALLPGGPLQCTGKAGVFDYYESVYRAGDETQLRESHGAGLRGVEKYGAVLPEATGARSR